jgi:signal transduction histidine kinase
VSELADAWPHAVAPGDGEAGLNPALSEVTGEWHPKSLMSVPLVARGHILGVLTFGSVQPNRYSAADVALAEELAHRAAVAMDNARLYQEAREAIRERDEFLSVAAQELKTPVTSLRGFAQVTLRRREKTGVLDPQQVWHAFRVIDRQSDRLSRLVSHLLDISRIDAGQLALDPVLAELTTVVRDVAQTAQATASRHTIVVRAPAAVWARVDRLRLEQVLMDLLDNAIKYSPEGGQIDVEVVQPAPGTVELAVRDRGIGIPPEHRHHIFDRFAQAHAGSYYGGMGLGLYVSRHIVELHGGQLQAHFPPDGGTRFVVRLPTDVPAPEVVAPGKGRYDSSSA